MILARGLGLRPPTWFNSGINLTGSTKDVSSAGRFLFFDGFSFVGLPGIEPGLHAPHACVLPVYYSPFRPNQYTPSRQCCKTKNPRYAGFFVVETFRVLGVLVWVRMQFAQAKTRRPFTFVNWRLGYFLE